MDDYSFKRKSEPTIQKHKDYLGNLNWGNKFVSNFHAGSKHSSFGLETRETTEQGNWIFMFIFIPPEYVKGTNFYTNPIDPNKSYEEFHKEFKATYFAFFNLQRRWNRQNLPNVVPDGRRAYKEESDQSNAYGDDWDKLFGNGNI